jgi:hypothetical protein
VPKRPADIGQRLEGGFAGVRVDDAEGAGGGGLSRGVFLDGAGSGAEHGGVGDRGDVDRGNRRGRAALAVADGVGDFDRAIDVRRGGEGEGAVGVDDDRALERIDGRAGDAERVAVRIGVVAEDGEGDGLIFIGGGGQVGDCRRAVVGAGDGDRHRGRGAVDAGDGEGFRAGLAFLQGLDFGLGVVEGVSPGAVGGERERCRRAPAELVSGWKAASPASGSTMLRVPEAVV